MVPDWVREAAALPVAFAQVREDPRLDVEFCQPGDEVVMVASGGDTVVCLSRLPLKSLLVVDINPAQLALTRCKMQLARAHCRGYAREWLGQAPLPAAERLQRLGELLTALDLPADSLGPPATVAAEGAHFTGRYERLFAALRRSLEPGRSQLLEQGVVPPGLDGAFAEVMSLPNLVALFGPQATQNPRQSFARHFAQRTRLALSRWRPKQNPFLWQIFADPHSQGPETHWLSRDAWGTPMIEPDYALGPMLETLEALPRECADRIHLSNILDWLSQEEAGQMLLAARRVLKPGGRLMVRQLNSSLNIPGLDCGLSWDEMDEARDRSFFYPQIHLATRP